MRPGSGLVLGSSDGLAVAEADATNDLGEAVRTVLSAPMTTLGRLGELETMASAVSRERQPLVLSVRSRAVAKVRSTGLVLRTSEQGLAILGPAARGLLVLGLVLGEKTIERCLSGPPGRPARGLVDRVE